MIKPAERLDDYIDNLYNKAIRHINRELIWIRQGTFWYALQDCLRDPYRKRDVAEYDEDLFLIHTIVTEEDPNRDVNVPYRSEWKTYNLLQTSILSIPGLSNNNHTSY